MEILKFLKSSFPKGQWELKKDGKIIAFFKALEGLSEDVSEEFKALIDETFPISKDSPSLEFWVSNFGIDQSSSKEEQYQEFMQAFSGSMTTSSLQYFRTFFASFASQAKNVTVKKETSCMAGFFAGSLLCSEGVSFSDLEVSINESLSESVKSRMKMKMESLIYRYYVNVRDKGGII